ncbi:unnamed protein product [Polarella glacialis]|uniref:Phospholipase B-like n=1 Tax=Polarella glacialis TaxID=89957 RepID=A0A813EAW5_POLGL|nr:unnamed protein product [Polarella glacialis]
MMSSRSIMGLMGFTLLLTASAAGVVQPHSREGDCEGARAQVLLQTGSVGHRFSAHGSGDKLQGAQRLASMSLSEESSLVMPASTSSSGEKESPGKDAKRQSSKPRCYLKMPFCRPWEGFAGTIRANQHVLAVAVKYGCAYVCGNKSSWATASHSTGTIDDLFGCRKGGVSVGSPALIASESSVQRLPTFKAQFLINQTWKTRIKLTQGSIYPKGGGDQLVLTGQALSMTPDPSIRQSAAVYQLDYPMTSKLGTYESTYPWLRAQWADNRLEAGRNVSLWGDVAWRIALQLRRGDRPHVCPLGLWAST